MWPAGAALDDVGAAVGSFGYVPAYAEFGSAAQLLLPRSTEVAGLFSTPCWEPSPFLLVFTILQYNRCTVC